MTDKETELVCQEVNDESMKNIVADLINIKNIIEALKTKENVINIKNITAALKTQENVKDKVKKAIRKKKIRKIAMKTKKQVK